MVISDVKYIKSYDISTGETDDTSYDAGDAKEIQFSLKPLVDYIGSKENVKLSFIPEEGDRVTFLKDAVGDWFSGLYDFEILSHRLSDPEDEASPLNIIIKFNASLPEIEDGVMVELWSPKKKMTGDEGENEIYYEFGHTYEIIGAGTRARRHAGNAQDQFQPLPAKIRLEGGDCYRRLRSMPIISDTDIVYYDRKVLDPYISDTDINSKQYSIGRPNYVDKEYRQFFNYSDIRYDQRFNANSNKIYNGHSNFLLLDFVTCERAFGPIISLQEVANTAEMLAVQHYGLQPVYTEKSPLYDFNNKESVGKSSLPAQLGTPLRKNIGSLHACSIVNVDGIIFGFSRPKKLLWQYAGNDLFNVSEEYGLKRGLIDLCDEYEGWDMKVVAVVDKRYGEVVWSFQPEIVELVTPDLGGGDVGGGGDIGGGVGDPGERLAEPASQTLALSYSKKGFVGHYSFIPEGMTKFFDSFVSFKSGQMWIHDTGTIGNFYAEITRPSVKFVIGQPGIPIDWFSMRLSSFKKWWIPLIEVPPTQNLPNGMKSRITENRFTSDEGYWWASLLNDYTDPYITGTEVEKLFKGRKLKSSILIVTAECAQDEQTTLREVAISVAASPETL